MDNRFVDRERELAALERFWRSGRAEFIFFRPERSIRQNVLEAIANPSARLYVEPQAILAAHHES